MVSYEGLGDLADGRRLLTGDFRGLGRDQLLFNNASDRNWWLGTFDGGAQAFVWALCGHTSGFGNLLAGHTFWTGRFSSAGRDQVLFYYPGDQNWWLGTVDDRLGQLRWVSAGNTSGFGNLQAGHRLWAGRFTNPSLHQMLMYSPTDQNWFLGAYDTITRKLKWSSAGNTSGFGDLQAGHMFWTGRFSQSERDEVLFYYPGDQNWWLGTYDAAAQKLQWRSAGNTSGFGNLLAGHKFWIGRFTQASRAEVLLYSPSDQNWFIGSYDAATTRLKWTSAGNSSGFGNLLAGHRFWTGRFSRSDRDQILFFYPGDQNWWLGSYAPPQLAWKMLGATGPLQYARAALTGSFSRSDRTEMLVQDPDVRRWWLASIDDDSGGFWWRFAMHADAPRAGAASTVLRAKLREIYGPSLPGCVFVVTRDGRPFADGSFGRARMDGASDGELAMTASTLVHVASVTKFFCAVAILRWIEEWNEIAATPPKPGEPRFDRTVHQFAGGITLDQPVFTLLAPLLEQALINSYPSYPGPNVVNITLRQLLDHTSGLPRIGVEIPWNVFEADLGGLRQDDIVNEPGNEAPTRFNLSRFVTALLKQTATFPPVYNNDAYAVLTAVIEATTDTPYATSLREHIFIDPRFEDLAPKAIDPARSARYYRFDGSRFLGGNHHPDYTDFTLAGGYYVSAAVLTEWVEAVIRKLDIGRPPRPILKNPGLLLSDRPGLGRYTLERFAGFDKNGGTGPGGGSTNSRVAFMRGYGGDERICAFATANANVDANPLLDAGLASIAEHLGRRPGLSPATVGPAGLHRTVFWDNAGTLQSDATDAPVDVQPIAVGGVTASRTRLFGGSPRAGGAATPDIVSADLRGSLRAGAAGYYVFRLSSDDGSFFWLQDELMADNSGAHGLRSVETDAVWLDTSAWYPIRVRWFNAGGGGNLCLEWRVPGATDFAAVPAANLAPDA